jgi:carbon storage regulator
MLVLTRRLNEKVVFPGFQASVQVLSIKGNAVRLGVQAPRAVTVLREEIPDRQAEWGSPAQVPAPDARRPVPSDPISGHPAEGRRPRPGAAARPTPGGPG